MKIKRTHSWFGGCLAACITLAGISAAADTQVSAPGKVEADGKLDVPAYQLPLSDFVSEQFKKGYTDYVQSTAKWPLPPTMNAPKAAWDKFDADADRLVFGDSLEYAKKNYPVDIVDTHMGGVHVAIVTPKGGVKPGNENRVLINFHGGGFFLGRGLTAGLTEAMPLASIAGIKVITVDYRMAPYNRYPAASEDSEAVYRELLKHYKPGQIGLYGCSAGGWITGQSMSWYRSKGLPRPGAAGIFCFAPVAPGKRGDSFIWGAFGLPWSASTGTMLNSVGWYMETANNNDPVAWPGVSDEELAKFPPTLLVTGTRAIEMSSAVFAHAKFLKLGVDSQLYVIEGGQHGDFLNGQYMTTETRDLYNFMAHWFDQKLEK